jgi:flagellar biogenesis protein FliO
MTEKPTRRVRGNSEPPPDIKYADLMPEEDGYQDDGTLIDFLIAITFIIAFIGIVVFLVQRLP